MELVGVGGSWWELVGAGWGQWELVGAGGGQWELVGAGGSTDIANLIEQPALFSSCCK